MIFSCSAPARGVPVLAIAKWRFALLVAILVGGNAPPARAQTAGPYSISGRVFDGTIGVSNVTVIASNLTVTADSRTGATDTNGNYLIAGLRAGTYAVTASRTGTLFNPSVLSVAFPTTNNATVVSNQNFVVVYNLGGRITDGLTGTAISGVSVTVRISGDTTVRQTADTDLTGAYRFGASFGTGTYEITPSRSNYVFQPTSRQINLGPSNTNVDFVGFAPFSIRGRITTTNLVPVAGVNVTVTGTNLVTLTGRTDSTGRFVFSNVLYATYQVTPSLLGYQFDPASRSVSSTTNLTFTATTGAVRGRITEGGSGIQGVMVTAADSTSTISTSTDAGGYYRFAGLAGTYVITPSQPGQAFNPARRTLSIEAGLTNVDFVRGSSTIATAVSTCDEASLSLAVRGGGTIALDCSGTIALETEIVVTTNAVLDGANQAVTISGGNTVPLFTVDPDVSFTLLNLTLVNGRHAGANLTNETTGASGGAGFGGAIYNDAGTLTAVGCVFSNNVAAGGNGATGAVQLSGRGGRGGNGGDANGGAIYNNSGTLRLTNCTFASNSAAAGAGGNGADAQSGSNGDGGNGGLGGAAGGGAIYNAPDGSIVVFNCTFASNRVSGAVAGTGGLGSGGLGFDGSNGSPGPGHSGGIYNNGGMVTVLFSTFHDNSASGANGGSGRDGIDDDDGVGGRSGSPANGGAIFTDGGTLALTNCTFFANSVTGGDGGNGGNGGTAGFGGDGGNGGLGGPGNGGAVYGARGATTTVVNCSFSDNNAIGGTGGLGGAAGSSVTRGGRDGADGAGFGGAVADGGGSFVLKNTILAYSSLSVNGAGTITDGGNNLSSDSSPPFTSPYSKNNLDPFLEPLTLNGGQTPTMALSPDSPAIDAADDSACLPEDQRHRARSGPCDIGAYEFDGLVPVAELTVRRTDGDLVLSWPTLVSGYTLESTPSLAPASWATVTNAPVVLGLEYVLTNMIEATNRFYRLVK